MHKTRSFAIGAALSFLAPLWAAGSSTAYAQAAVSRAAPDFTLPSVDDGKAVALKALAATHKAVVVLFIATKCPFSNAYNERMEALAHDYAKRGVTVIGINANKTEPAADVAAHRKAHGFSFAVLKDEGSKVADRYGAAHTPEAYLVDGQGTLVYHGRIDDNYDEPTKVKSTDLKNALDALLAGRPVGVPETKAFGCSIKR
jgi:peroxiredoxin